MFDALKRAFTSHLETIIRRYKESLKSQRERINHRLVSRRRTRKYQVCPLVPDLCPVLIHIQLFHKRRYLAYTFKPLRKHISILERLGIDGMSSDESETEDVDGQHHTQFQILAPLWRARRISGWLRMFDSIHNILRRGGDTEASQGSFPRRRRAGQRRSSSAKFVAGLPINAYDSDWIARDARRRYDLRPSTEHYDFNHDDDIMEYVPFPVHGAWSSLLHI